MRLNPLLLAPRQRSARAPQVEPVPFKMLWPLELTKKITGKQTMAKESFCMQEMAVMFTCLKKSEFNQGPCSPEIAKFKGCFKNYYDEFNKRKLQEKKGVLVSGEKNLTYGQKNKLLKGYPPKNNIF